MFCFCSFDFVFCFCLLFIFVLLLALFLAHNNKRKYLQACQDQRVTFTPLCVSVNGMLGSEAKFFVTRLGDFLAARWERPYSVVMGWVRARLSFANLRAALLCVRGSRTKWRSLGIVDGASLPINAAD